MKQFETGVVIGKFYPPHRGHHYLIDTAIASCQQVTVIVCHKPDQTVPISVRLEALCEEHPEAEIIPVNDTLADDDTLGWAAFTIELLGKAPDAVFTSEDYGDPYARAMGCRHIMVDRHRVSVPCSGTMLRTNPLEHLQYLSPRMIAYYVKRICVVGAESTGTTTMAMALADYYKTEWVPEYGREYSEIKMDADYNGEWNSDEFVKIAIEQSLREDAAARIANRVLICDTDPFATTLWHKRYMGYHNKQVREIADSRHYDLYLLTGDEIPFVQDGLRDGEDIRHDMHRQFIDELTSTGRRWQLLTGTHEERLRKAVGLIDKILALSGHV
jgi:HTH-type transcriptional repressor of NAD biosynthesis genes